MSEQFVNYKLRGTNDAGHSLQGGLADLNCVSHSREASVSHHVMEQLEVDEFAQPACDYKAVGIENMSEIDQSMGDMLMPALDNLLRHQVVFFCGGENIVCG